MTGTMTWVTAPMRWIPPKMTAAVTSARTAPTMILTTTGFDASKDVVIESAMELDCTALNTNP